MRVLSFVVACLVGGSSLVFAQSAPSHGWVDFNVATFQAAQGGQTVTLTDTVYLEPATASASYPALPRATGFDVAAGFALRGPIGAGVNVTTTSYTYTAVMSMSIPHPWYFDLPGSASAVTDRPLERSTTAVDLQAVVTPRTPEAWRIRLFAGPTYFHLRQDMVASIRYAQVYTVFGDNDVTITDFTPQAVRGSAWGFNAGADVTYFLGRYVGVGGTVRVNRGTVTVESEPLTAEPVDLTVGGVMVGGGLRLRF